MFPTSQANLFADLCAAFEELVGKRDWRLHPKGKSGG